MKRQSDGKRALLLLLCLTALLQLVGCAVPVQAKLPAETAAPKISAPPATKRAFDGSGLVWQATPGSSCFSEIAYDAEFDVLAVIFRSNTTRVYLYYDFSAEDWTAFSSADSLGSYYNKNIKGQFSGDRIDDAEAFRKLGK